jgi:hypothetical protein
MPNGKNNGNNSGPTSKRNWYERSKRDSKLLPKAWNERLKRKPSESDEEVEEPEDKRIITEYDDEN